MIKTERLNAHDARVWQACVRAGDFEAAWRASDRIRTRTDVTNDPSLPRHFQQIWDGRPLIDQRVLIRCYHGLGDTIQFIRYAPLVGAIAREVIVWAQPVLLPLLSGMEGVDRFEPLTDGRPPCPYDVDVEVMELPYVFRTSVSTIPNRVPYLRSYAIPLSERRPRIGIIRRAGEWNPQRSIPRGALAPLFDAVRGVSWFDLSSTNGITELAAWLCAMDLVLTVDSMPAHLAGALALPVWTLLPKDADWRWMEQRSDTPWYPTMRLFRQPEPDDWPSVIRTVTRVLLAQPNF